MSKSRDTFVQSVLPRLMDRHPDGIVSKKELTAECTRANIPFAQWATHIAEGTTKAGRGLYNISKLFKLTDVGQPNFDFTIAEEPITDTRTDEEIAIAINNRFAAVDRMAEGLGEGKFRSMLVSGNPGIGKTYNLESIFDRLCSDGSIQLTKVSGFVKATGLFRLFWENREPNQIIMLDDCDAIFTDEVALNLLKAACDSTHRRWISWRSEKKFDDKTGSADADENGDIPKEFEFKGHIAFVTNLDFDKLILAQNRIAPHLEALVSRAFYLDLNISSTRELFIRIKEVVNNTDMLMDFNDDAKVTIIGYMERNVASMREISLRMVLKLSQLYRSSKNNEDFEIMAHATCLKRI